MRRKSDAHTKAEQAAKLAAVAPDGEAPPAAEGTPAVAPDGAGTNPSPAASAADDPDLDDGDADPDPEPAPRAKVDPDAPRQAPIFAPDRKRPGVLRSPTPGVPEPNRPSFAWKRDEAGEIVPDLQAGEVITAEGELRGVRFVRTSRTRFIYLCTAQEYEQKVDELIPRETFKVCFPHAFE